MMRNTIIKNILFLLLFPGFVLSQGLTHFKIFKTKTGSSANIVIIPSIKPQAMGTLLVKGDEIAVFAADNVCYGGVVWGDSVIDIKAWGDDSQTPSIKEGFSSGELILYRIWVKKSGIEYLAKVKYSSGIGLSNGYFSNNSIMVLDSLVGYKKVGVNKLDIAPDLYSLYQNYPNPFNPSTKIRFSINEIFNIRVDVLDINGKVVRVLMNEKKYPGAYSIEWDAADKVTSLPSGIYFCRLMLNNKFADIKKMVLIR